MNPSEIYLSRVCWHQVWALTSQDSQNLMSSPSSTGQLCLHHTCRSPSGERGRRGRGNSHRGKPVHGNRAERKQGKISVKFENGNRSMATEETWFAKCLVSSMWAFQMAKCITHFEITFVTSKQKKVSCYTKICKNGSQSIARIPFWINHQDMLLRGARHVSRSPPHVGRYMTASLVP